jgi:hypothetical protein
MSTVKEDKNPPQPDRPSQPLTLNQKMNALFTIVRIMVKQFTPLSATSTTITWSIYKDSFARCFIDLVKVEGFGMALCDRGRVEGSRQRVRGRNCTGFLLVRSKSLRPRTAFKRDDFPTFARPVTMTYATLSDRGTRSTISLELASGTP